MLKIERAPIFRDAVCLSSKNRLRRLGRLPTGYLQRFDYVYCERAHILRDGLVFNFNCSTRQSEKKGVPFQVVLFQFFYKLSNGTEPVNGINREIFRG